jgi:competence protein ComEA
MAEGAKWQLVAVVAAAALAVFALVRMLDREPAPSPVRVEGGIAASGPATHGRGGGGGRGGVFVHVAGAVRRPGVYRVPAGARVDLAVRRAGGPAGRADLTAVNLAAPVEDGQQVVVPLRAPGAAAAAAAGAEAPLNLATATTDQLEELDGIGETLAERIVEYRDEHGGLRGVEELREVDGIGEARFEALREALGR